MPETLGTRLAEFASSLRNLGTIRSDAVEHAFASVARHRCMPQFRYGPKTITVPQNEQPGSQVLDIIYSHQSLLTSTGQNGDPPFNHDGTVSARAALWADFMPAAGPLRPAELVGHDPADYVPPAPVTRIPDTSPARTPAAYNDLWFFLATRDSRITRAYLDDDTVDTTTGACALRTPRRGTAWVHTDGSIAAVGEPVVADELRSLIHEWTASGQAALTQFTAMVIPTDTEQPLWTPSRWTLDAMETAAHTIK